MTNPEKLLWPEKNITKAMYLEKLAQLAPYLLKYCRDRYLTTIRFPHGWNDKSFYQKKRPGAYAPFRENGDAGGHSLRASRLAADLAVARQSRLSGVSPVLPPDRRKAAGGMADRHRSELDPEPRIMEAAEVIGDILDKMNIRSIPKTSGATGVQIYVPIPAERGYTFEQLRRIAHSSPSMPFRSIPGCSPSSA